MALLILLLRLIFHVIATLLNPLSFLLARSLALLVVASLQLLKIPGGVVDGALDIARATLSSAAHHALALLGSAFLSLVRVLAGAAAGCFVLAASKLDGLVVPPAKIATGEFLVEVFGGAVEMFAAVAHNAASNCMDAMRFVIKNA